MKFKSQETAQKLRGGYYTPEDLADYVSRWALAHSPQQILEPSCGDGRFIESVARQVDAGYALAPAYFDAVELMPSEAQRADQNANGLRQKHTEVAIHNVDFLDWILTQKEAQWDAVV
ncbi:MAG: SAM-dependent methyltransferase, partial [Chloroflexota bacterium]